MTNIYINIAVIGSVNEVLSKILFQITKSGLYEYCDVIYLVVNGDFELLNFEMKEKYKVILANEDISHCEFPTLDLIWQHSNSNPEVFNILYLHTKGVTKPNFLTISDWTELLTYFNIEEWQGRINELNNFDCTGVNLNGVIEDFNEPKQTWGFGKVPLHYSGNFWWTKSSHINTLPNPYTFLPEPNPHKWRILAEMWLCQNPNSNYNTSWQSNTDHYINRYPREIYDKNFINKTMKTIINYLPTQRQTPRLAKVGSAWGDIPTIIFDIINKFNINTKKALEFGVEYGYSTSALANYFEQVIGVDTFTGDIHSSYKNDHFSETAENLKDFPNITLVKSDYQDYISENQEIFDLIHVDIIHNYEHTYKCGEWSVKHAKVVIFHDTESFYEVRKACTDLSNNFNLDFYNYPHSHGLGILVNNNLISNV